MTRHSLFLLTLALLLPITPTQAAPPPPNLNDLPAYLSALNHSTDPEAKAVRLQIADGPAALARERAAAEKEGIFTRLSQLSHPLPPESQNAAPLYAQLAALRKQTPLHFPQYAQPLTGRYACTPEQVAAVQKEYDARQDIFTLLHQATDRPDYVLPPNNSSIFNPPMLDYAGLREDARELKTESFLLATQGCYSEAIVQQTRGYRVAAHVGSIPTLISYLVAVAIDSIATSGFQDILSMVGPNAAIDAQVALAVRENSGHFSLTQALRGEVALTDGTFATLRRDGPAALADFATDDPPPSALVKHTLTPAQKHMYLNFIDAVEADYIHQMRQVIQAADTTNSSAAFAQAKQETVREPSSNIVSNLATVFIPFHNDVLNGLPMRGAASCQVTLAAAFLLGEKAKTGAYPDTLPQEFRDPFTNKPLGYRRESADSFVVYSAGPTGKFDGGQAGATVPPGEAVFRYPAQTVPVSPEMLK